MKSYDLMLEIYTALTGLDTPPKSGNFWASATHPSFDGYKVIYTGDRIPDTMPMASYPYILIEQGDITTIPERKGFKKVGLYFSVGVENKNGEASKQTNQIASTLAEWLSTTRFTNAVSIYPESITFSIGERGSQFIGTRYADITASAVVVERW